MAKLALDAGLITLAGYRVCVCGRVTMSECVCVCPRLQWIA